MAPSLRPWHLSVLLVLATVLLAFSPLGLEAECTPYWTKSQAVAVGAGYGPTAMADFNGDDIPDVATQVSNSGLWKLLTNAESRQLGAPTQVAAQTGLIGLIAEDITGDGKSDLLILDKATPALKTFAGIGDGTFASAVVTTLPAEPALFASGDFNGDAFRDVAVRGADATTVSLWLGTSSGAFTAGESTSASVPLGRLVVGDLSGDDLEDVLVARTDLHGLLLFSGNGDGTLDDPLEIGDGEVVALAAADLDADGDTDVITTSDSAATMLVHRNDGDGTFTAPVSYTTEFHWYVTYSGKVRDIAIGNVTSDSVPDVVLTLASDGLIATFVGTGGGAFAPARFAFAETADYKKDSPSSPLLTDIDGDARLDLLYRGAYDVAFAPNNCGDVTLTTTVLTPVVSVGDSIRVATDLRHSSGFDVSGDVTVFEATDALATGEAHSEIELPVLPEGTHILHSGFTGNNFFHPALSETVTATVTSETTAATLALAAWAQLPLRYGESAPLEPAVTSTIAGAPTGTLEVYFDGALSSTAPCCDGFASRPLPVGTHEYSVRYLGDSTHPPSPRSDPLVLSVEPAPSSIYFHVPPHSNAGELVTITANADAPGTVEVLDGGTVIGSVTTSSEDAHLTFQLALPLGNHQLAARFDGHPNYLPAESILEHTVTPASGTLSLDAHAHGTSIHLTWSTTASDPAQYYYLQQRIGGIWQTIAEGLISFRSSGELTINNTQAGTYIYQMFISTASGRIGPSNTEVASVGAATDETLVPGVTPVRSQHFTNVLAGINRLRAANAAPPLSMPALGSRQVVRYQDLLELRHQLNQARAALGMLEFPFTDRGTSRTILVRDIEELRNAVR